MPPTTSRLFKRGNTRMVDLSLDAALIDDSAKPWDILSDP
jgi:hypothetical protein